MKFMIFGTGNAREYATFRRLRDECPSEPPLLVTTAPAALLEGEVGVYQVDDVNAAIEVGHQHGVQQALVISPNPIFEAGVDRLRAAGIPTIGPTAHQGALEQSKALAATFAAEAGIPSPLCLNARGASDAAHLLMQHWSPMRRLVVKADGFVDNAAYRTIVPASLEEALQALHEIREHVGKDGPFVIQERLDGPELSLHVAIDHSGYAVFPAVTDYKRLSACVDSPMTHGMGAVACAVDPAGQYAALEAILRESVVEPTIEAMRSRSLAYQGILYIGVMLTAEGPRVLEYNVRPGNPEWLSLLALLDSPVTELFDALSHSRIASTRLRFKAEYAVSLFAVSRGYPFTDATPQAKNPIRGLTEASRHSQIEGESLCKVDKVFSARPGRVASVTATHPKLSIARESALRAMDHLHFDGKTIRADVGMQGPLGEPA